MSNGSCVALPSLASRLHLQPLPPLIVAKDYDRAQLSCLTASHESYLKCHSSRHTAALVPVIAQLQTEGFDPFGASSCLAKRFWTNKTQRDKGCTCESYCSRPWQREPCFMNAHVVRVVQVVKQLCR